MQVPVDATTNRYEYRYWDGSLDEATSKSTTDYTRFDLRDVDPDVIVGLVDEARSRVEDPTSWYAIVRQPDDEYDNGTWISAYATNEFGESAYLGGDQEGTSRGSPPPGNLRTEHSPWSRSAVSKPKHVQAPDGRTLEVLTGAPRTASRCCSTAARRRPPWATRPSTRCWRHRACGSSPTPGRVTARRRPAPRPTRAARGSATT